MVLDALTWFFLLTGSFLGITGAWGIIKFPDFYSRVHAASITDTLCASCFVLGLICQSGFSLVSVKLILVLLLLLITGPAAAHALVKAAHTAGLRALTGKITPSIRRQK
ncbi:MAG: monovalent cation/H(+) antiporter subunit G [Pseudomonadota bacterium]